MRIVCMTVKMSVLQLINLIFDLSGGFLLPLHVLHLQASLGITSVSKSPGIPPNLATTKPKQISTDHADPPCMPLVQAPGQAGEQ